MKSRNKSRLKGPLIAGALTMALLLPAQGQPRQPASPNPSQQGKASDLQKIQAELGQLSQKLVEIQNEASKEKDVQKSLDKFEEGVAEKMASAAPELKDQVEQLHELRDELNNSKELRKNPGERSETFEKKLGTYQKLNQQLQPIQQQAYQDPKVVKLRGEYYDELLSAMKEVDPKTQEILDRRNTLTAQMQQIQQQQQQQQRPPQPKRPQ